MKKRIILGSIVLILITATSCNINTDNNESNISDSQTQSIDTSSTLSQPQSSPETLSKPESQVLSHIDEKVYIEAMNKFNTMEHNQAFKNVNELDTEELLSLYVSYLFNLQRDYGDWVTVEEFDKFVNEYFNLSGEKFHKNFPGADPVNYDEEKGFRTEMNKYRIPDDSTHQLLDYGQHSDGTCYMRYQSNYNWPIELVEPGENNIQERIIYCEFIYENENIYFVSASYKY